MKYMIDEHDSNYQDVVICNAKFSKDNKNCCNTTALLERYKYMAGSITVDENTNKFYFKSVKKPMLTSLNLTDERVLSKKIVSINSHIDMSAYRRQSCTYQSNKEIVSMIADALKYLEMNDKYGKLIRIMIESRFMNETLTDNERIRDAVKLLLGRDTLHEITYHKYLRYSIKQLDDYLFGSANPNLNFLLQYIDSIIRRNNKDIRALRGVYTDEIQDYELKLEMTRYFVKKQWKVFYEEHISLSRTILYILDNLDNVADISLQSKLFNDYLTSYMVETELSICLEKANIFDCGYDMGKLLTYTHLEPTKVDLSYRINKNNVDSQIPPTTRFRNCRESIETLTRIIWNEMDSNNYLQAYIKNSYN